MRGRPARDESPIANGRSCCFANACTRETARRLCSNARRASRMNKCPALVMLTLLVCRSKSFAPSVASTSATCRERAGCVTWQRRAAREVALLGNCHHIPHPSQLDLSLHSDNIERKCGLDLFHFEQTYSI